MKTETYRQGPLGGGGAFWCRPRYIEECFPAAIFKTDFQDLQMEMRVIPGTVKCLDCRKEFNGYEYNLLCPKCSGENLIPLNGQEFIIKEIYGY